MRSVVGIASLALGLSLGCNAASSSQTITLATTTTVRDSGILDELLAYYQAKSGNRVRAITVGSGQALELARRGDADVIFTHDPSGEEKFLAEGYGTSRQEVMYNDFVLVGPPEDPAQIATLKSGPEAFRRIMERQATFISRGDRSGTHQHEKAVWSSIGVSPSGDWYVTSGEGMAAVLRMADHKRAYTLSDRGTYLAQHNKLQLAILFAGDPAWVNRYAVIPVHPAKHPHVKHDLAKQFAEFLVTPDCQRFIANFGRDQFGEPLFKPGSPEALWRRN